MATDLDRAVTVLDRSDTSNLILLHDPTWVSSHPAARSSASASAGTQTAASRSSRPTRRTDRATGPLNWEDLQKQFQQIALEAGHSFAEGRQALAAYRYLAADDAQYWGGPRRLSGEGREHAERRLATAPMIDQAL